MHEIQTQSNSSQIGRTTDTVFLLSQSTHLEVEFEFTLEAL